MKRKKDKPIHKTRVFVQISDIEREGIIGVGFWKADLWGDIRPAVVVCGREGIDFKIVPIAAAERGRKA